MPPQLMPLVDAVIKAANKLLARGGLTTNTLLAVLATLRRLRQLAYADAQLSDHVAFAYASAVMANEHQLPAVISRDLKVWLDDYEDVRSGDSEFDSAVAAFNTELANTSSPSSWPPIPTAVTPSVGDVPVLGALGGVISEGIPGLHPEEFEDVQFSDSEDLDP